MLSPDVLASIQKQFGEDAFYPANTIHQVSVIPTGSLSLDYALGIGGIPKGRIIEIYGPEANGKTSLCQAIVANTQRMGGTAAYIDKESGTDPVWMGKWGIDLATLPLAKPETGETAIELLKVVIRTGVDLVVVDSVSALTPKAVIEGDVGDAHIGLLARLLSTQLPVIAGLCKQHNTTVIFVNQIRLKIGVMFGSPETTSGGEALKFYNSVKIDVRKPAPKRDKATGELKNKKAFDVKFTVRKNKLAPPLKICKARMLTNGGFDVGFDFLEIGSTMGILEGSRGSYSYKEQRLPKGKENTIEFLGSDEPFAIEIRNAIRERLRLPLEQHVSIESNIGAKTEQDRTDK